VNISPLASALGTSPPQWGLRNKEQKMSQKTLTQADLAYFTGTETWFRHGLARNVLYTEGAQYVAEHGGAYWLIDAIAFSQSEPSVAHEDFQLWTLTVKPDHSATLVCSDGNNNVVYSRDITFTDFPLDEIRFYFTNNVILLPSEY